MRGRLRLGHRAELLALITTAVLGGRDVLGKTFHRATMGEHMYTVPWRKVMRLRTTSTWGLVSNIAVAA